jgi:DNA-binding response OmpR family regulator
MVSAGQISAAAASPNGRACLLSVVVTTPAILLVEDDAGIAAGLVRALEHEGYRASTVPSGAAAIASVASDPPDLVLLDLGLPDVDGLIVCQQLLAIRPQLRIAVLTARRDELDVVVGLDAGAVDYITKPFRLAELLARVRAHVRNVPNADRLSVADLDIDLRAHRVLVGGTELTLRPKEYELLVRLAMSAGELVTREQLMSDVWDEHWFGSTKTLDVHIAVVRHKLGDRSAGPGSITTIRGVGYRLEAG